MKFFITGGSRGIGARFVLDAVAAGHDVAFTFRTADAAAAEVLAQAAELAPDRMCRAYRLDVRDSRAVEAVADAVTADFDKIDAVVCNAGVTHQSLVINLSDETWREVLDTNLTGAFYVCRQFVPIFLGQRRGRFILISTVSTTGCSGMAAYAASKAGLHGLCRSLAKEYGPKGITSNVLALGLFDTDLSRFYASDYLRSFWQNYCPARRIGELGEISQAILFLASDAAGFVNGQVIGINGGLDWVP